MLNGGCRIEVSYPFANALAKRLRRKPIRSWKKFKIGCHALGSGQPVFRTTSIRRKKIRNQIKGAPAQVVQQTEKPAQPGRRAKRAGMITKQIGPGGLYAF